VIVLVEGTISDAARKWAVACQEEGEEVDPAVSLGGDGGSVNGEEQETRPMLPFYRDKLGFKTRSHFFWGRKNSSIPRVFYVMQYC
jgi:hypothetical protein